MAWHQIARKLSEAEITSIVIFLDTLTGRIDPRFVARPRPGAP